jgi:hypothetical protein
MRKISFGIADIVSFYELARANSPVEGLSTLAEVADFDMDTLGLSEVMATEKRPLSPEEYKTLLSVSGILFDRGNVKIEDYASSMVELLGEWAKPHIIAFYEMARAGNPVVGMSNKKEMYEFDIDTFQPIKKQADMNAEVASEDKGKVVQASLFDEVAPPRLINHPWAMRALWKLAESLPSKLMEMSQNQPMNLLEQIEETVQDALNWKELVLKKGMDKLEVEEIALTMLEPSYVPQNPEKLEVTELQMAQIYKTLVELSNEKPA